MSLYNTTNIKNLPQVDQIVDTDYLIVENYSGTNKLRFKDFVVGPTNTSFFNSIKTNLSELSAYDRNNTKALSGLSAGVVNVENKVNVEANKLLNLQEYTYNTLNNTISAFTNGISLTAKMLEETNTSLTTNLTGLTAFMALNKQIKYTFRWNLSGMATPENTQKNYTESRVYLEVPLPFKIDISDISYIGPYQDSIPGSLYYTDLKITNYSLSCLSLRPDENSGTYTIMFTANKPVPPTWVSDYKAPFQGEPDTTPTFVIKIIATNVERTLRYDMLGLPNS